MTRRRSWPLPFGALVVMMIAGCVRPAESPPDPARPTLSTVDSSAPPSAPAPVSTTNPARPPVSIRAAVDAAERAVTPGMTLGVAVLDVATGELVEGREAQRQFYSASLSKLIVVVDMLDRRRSAGLAISASDLALIARSLRSSDDGAMNVLWGKFDGRGAVKRVVKNLGLTATQSPENPSEWGETLVSATDLVRIYQHILRDMGAEDRGVIVSALAAAAPVATDGFDQLFGLLYQGASVRTYAKQAWVSYRPSRLYLHSAGVVHDSTTGNGYAVALLSIQQSAGAPAARARVSAVAAAVVQTLGTG